MRQAAEILVVEDDADDLELTMRALRKHQLGDRVAVVRDGAEAIAYLFGTGPYESRASDANPRVVLLDLELPLVNGLEVLRRIRADERTKHIPVVVLTSSSELRDLDECYRGGTNSYVVKPVESSEFENAVSRLGSYWLDLNQTPSG
ncbi:MAG TPA: response regulator [Vicinamibacteria bacterium]|jgi:CheY-like chemotaxis protein